MGAFFAGSAVVCWYVMDLHGHLERTAWMLGFGISGSIVAVFPFSRKTLKIMVQDTLYAWLSRFKKAIQEEITRNGNFMSPSPKLRMTCLFN